MGDTETLFGGPGQSGEGDASTAGRRAPTGDPKDAIAVRYALSSVLGVGPHGTCYTARSVSHPEGIIVKVFDRLPPFHEDGVERHRRRLAQLAGAHATFSSSFLEVGRDPVSGSLFVARPHDRVGSLARRPGASVGWRDGSHAAWMVLDALAAAHGSHLCHGAVKPSNVLLDVDRDGALRPRLVDPAPWIEATPPPAQPTVAAADVVGVLGILYQLIADVPPWPWGTSLVSRLAAGGRPPRELVPSANRDIPGALVDLVSRSLRSAFGGDPPSASALHEALTPWCAPRSAGPPPAAGCGDRDEEDRTLSGLALRTLERAVRGVVAAPPSVDLEAALLRAALGLIPCEAAALLATHGDTPRILRHEGTSLDGTQWTAAAREAASARQPRCRRRPGGAGWELVVPCPGTDSRIALLLAGGPRDSPPSAALRAAAGILAAAGAAALDRRASRAAVVSETDCRGALMDVATDGLVVLGPMATVRALNGPAATLLDVNRHGAAGARLPSLSGLGELARALESGRAHSGDLLRTPAGRVTVRARSFRDGVVAALRPVGRAPAAGPGRAATTFDSLMGESSVFRAAIEEARLAARVGVPVLVVGEPGTGKDSLAEAIHNASQRAAGPLVWVRLPALPPEEVDAALFGHAGERGVTGHARAGRLELAHGGTVVLDEISVLSEATQASLGRFLVERAVRPVGGRSHIAADTRVIATSRVKASDLLAAGLLRRELFDRLRVLQIELPPLRERGADAAVLARARAAAVCRALGRPPVQFEAHVLDALCGYEWPGNVTELLGLVEGWIASIPATKTHIDRVPGHIAGAGGGVPAGRAAPAARGSTARTTPARGPAGGSGSGGPASRRIRPWTEVERETFAGALRTCDGNVSRAARALGVSRGTFYNKMRRFGLKDGGDHG